MTTEPSLFWVDPGELSLLLREAGVSPAPGYPSPAEPPEARPVVPSRPGGGGDDADPPPFAIPVGSFDDRLRALLDWIRAVVAFEHAFVVDQEGLALVHESAPLELIAASAAMSESWESLRNRFDLSARSHLTIDLGLRKRLHLLAAASPWGLLSLGFVAAEPIPEASITAIRQHFQSTLDAEGADRP